MEREDFQRIIEAARADLTAQAALLGWDAGVRLEYSRLIEQMSQELTAEVRAGRMTWTQAARRANESRNVLLEIMRGRSTPIGRAVAEAIKRQGLTLNQVIAKYTVELHGAQADFNRLTNGQKNAVYAKIVERAGASSPRVNQMMRWGGRAARGLVILSIGISVYNVATAEDPGREAVREAAVMGSGILGGAAGGAAAGLICGPGAPVCVTVGAFIGGAAAAFGVDLFLFD